MDARAENPSETANPHGTTATRGRAAGGQAEKALENPGHSSVGDPNSRNGSRKLFDTLSPGPPVSRRARRPQLYLGIHRIRCERPGNKSDARVLRPDRGHHLGAPFFRVARDLRRIADLAEYRRDREPVALQLALVSFDTPPAPHIC